MLDSGKILQRFFKNAKYSDDEWELLEKMLSQNESWRIICQQFNLSKQYYKVIKNYYDRNGSIY
jgi:hypothetical protein